MSNASWNEKEYRQAKRDRKARAKHTRETAPPKPPQDKSALTLQELMAVNRHEEGRASGDDFVLVARALKKSGALDGWRFGKLSDRELADKIQAADYLIEEGFFKFDVKGGKA